MPCIFTATITVGITWTCERLRGEPGVRHVKTQADILPINLPNESYINVTNVFFQLKSSLLFSSIMTRNKTKQILPLAAKSN